MLCTYGLGERLPSGVVFECLSEICGGLLVCAGAEAEGSTLSMARKELVGARLA